MPKHQTCITVEMQAEDNIYIFLHEKVLCLQNKFSGKVIPKKQCNNKAFRTFYNRHMKGLKKAFEEAYTLSALSLKKQEDKKALKLLWALYQTCKNFDCQWSLVKRCIAIKKKSCSPKEYPMPKAERKNGPLSLVGPLNVRGMNALLRE
eukprot:1284139-Ditylum_brightwellii.AAC.1